MIIEYTGDIKSSPVRKYQVKYRKFEEFAKSNMENEVVKVAFEQIKRAYESWESSGIVTVII